MLWVRPKCSKRNFTEPVGQTPRARPGCASAPACAGRPPPPPPRQPAVDRGFFHLTIRPSARRSQDGFGISGFSVDRCDHARLDPSSASAEAACSATVTMVPLAMIARSSLPAGRQPCRSRSGNPRGAPPARVAAQAQEDRAIERAAASRLVVSSGSAGRSRQPAMARVQARSSIE